MTTIEPSLSDVALITCPACGHRVSERAVACPRCGDPIRVDLEVQSEAPTPRRKGDAGNVMAGVVSFVLPGVGQLVQGRFMIGVMFVMVTFVAWILMLGWIMHIVAAWEAAVWNGED